MKTACPHCDSHLTLTQEQTQQRQGMVRCGVCRQVFNALEHLIEDDYPILEQDDEPVLMPSSQASRQALRPESSARYPTQHIPPQRHQATSHQATSYQPTSHQAYSHDSEDNFDDEQTPAAHVEPPRGHVSLQRASASTASRASTAPASATVPTAVHIHLNQSPSSNSTSTPTMTTSSAHAYEYAERGTANVVHELGSSQVRIEDDDYYIDHAAARRAPRDTEFSIQSDSSYDEEYAEYEPRRSGGMFWFFLVLIAIALLIGQFTYVFRNQISTLLPSARPMLVQMCGFLNCHLGFSKSIEDLELSQVNVGIDSSLKPNAGEQGLRLQAQLLNKGSAASEWPSLVLTLKNATGSVTNRKVIEPRQYVLPEQLMQNFLAGAQVLINLPFILSGAEVSNYELGLFFP